MGILPKERTMYTTPPGVHAKLMYWFQFGKNDSQYGALAQLLTSARPLYRPQKFTIGSNVFVHKLLNTRLTLFCDRNRSNNNGSALKRNRSELAASEAEDEACTGQGQQ